MDILRKLRGLESKLTKTVNGAAQKLTQTNPQEPLEIMHAVVDTVEKRVEPAGRGKYVFPFNRIRIYVAAASMDTKARFEAVFETDPSLQDRIIDALKTAGCYSPQLSIETSYVDGSEVAWAASGFLVEFERVAGSPEPKPQTNTSQQSLRLTIIHGATEQPNYVFTTPRINLGRCPEVRDHRNRLIRTNHVAFSETPEDLNRSVSRNHAHIDCTDSAGEYRLCDDRSVHGTSVQRNGTTIPVPPGVRGVRLQSGDEITLGEARLQVQIGIGDMGADPNAPMSPMR